MNVRLARRVVTPTYDGVGTSQRRISGRPSLVLSLHGPWGVVQGEATPLEGFGSDSFGQAEEELGRIEGAMLLDVAVSAAARFNAFVQGDATAEPEALGLVAQVSSTFQSPSARFCAEMLILGAAAGSCGVPVWRLLATNWVSPRLSTSAVLDPLHPLARRRARDVVASGVRNFKIKCGRDTERELSFVHDLARLTPLPKLRLDPNQAWDRDATVSFIDRLKDVTIEWIEDPTPRFEEWTEITRLTGVECAIDEPLSDHPSDDVLRRSGAGFVILKPMALGGFIASLGWARQALALQMPVNVSHLFDGPIALEACAHLAFAVQSQKHVPGLGNHAALDGYAALGYARPALLRPGHLAAPPATFPGAR